MIIVDTNIIIRFLLKDHPILSPEAKSIIESNTLYIDPLIIAETIWVLTSFYDLKPEDVVASLVKFLGDVSWTSSNKSTIMKSLNLHQHHNLSYIDCWLLALSKKKRLTLKTQDDNLKKTSSQLNQV